MSNKTMITVIFVLTGLLMCSGVAYGLMTGSGDDIAGSIITGMIGMFACFFINDAIS